MDITVNLRAEPALLEAINRLCSALHQPISAGAPTQAPSAPTPSPAPAAPSLQYPHNIRSPLPMQQLQPFAPSRSGPSAPPAPAAPPPTPLSPVPTAATQYTYDMLFGATADLMSQNKGAQLQQLLTKYGVQRLPDLPREQYGAFATDLRGLGVKI